MAKSLRSKWRRKCRAVKRERYGAKELERLKKTLGMNENGENTTDVNMTDITEVATVVDAKTIKENAKAKNDQEEEIEKMEQDGGRIYNKKTLRDQYGNYPVWMNRRHILKHKKGRAKNKKATAKVGKRLTRRQKKVTHK